MTIDKQTNLFIQAVVVRCMGDVEVQALKGLSQEEFGKKFKPMIERLMKETVDRQKELTFAVITDYAQCKNKATPSLVNLWLIPTTPSEKTSKNSHM